MPGVHVVAALMSNPGQRADVLALFNEMMPPVLAEEGCIAYEATIDTKDRSPTQTEYGSDTFVVIEKRANLTALCAHSARLHLAAFAERTKDIMTSRTVHILSPLKTALRLCKAGVFAGTKTISVFRRRPHCSP